MEARKPVESLSVIMDRVKFWLVVRDCLIIIHGRNGDEARLLISQFIDVNGNDTLVYDFTPFKVSCALCQNDVNINDWLPHLIDIHHANGV